MVITVIVDDADPRIQYTGSWSTASPSSLGPDYLGLNHSIGNTLHNASVSDAFNLGFASMGDPVFTYSFNGTAISVYALMSMEVAERVGDSFNWFCTIDGIGTIPIALQHIQQASTYQICTANGLNTTTEHTLRFSLSPVSTSTETNVNQTTSMLFDYLEYTPLISAVNRTFDYVSVSYDNPGLIYDGNWNLVGGTNRDIGSGAPDRNSWAQYVFTGTSITWVGIADASSGVSMAQFSIDGNSRVPEQLPTVNSTLIVPNVILFQSGPLDGSKVHIVRGTMLDDLTGETPGPSLILQSLIIQNGTISAVSSPQASPTNTSPSPSATATTHLSTTNAPPKVSIKLITGVILGVLGSASMIVAILYILRRYRGHKSQQRIKHFAKPFTTDQQVRTNRDLSYFQNLLLPSTKAAERYEPPNIPLTLPPVKQQLHTGLVRGASGRTHENQNLQAYRPTTIQVRRNAEEVPSGITSIPMENSGTVRRVNPDIGLIEIPPLYTVE